MKYLRLFEEFNTKIISLDQSPQNANYYCGRCDQKQPSKPSYGDHCENDRCDLTVGKKVDVLTGDTKLPDGYYLNGPQYDNKIAHQLIQPGSNPKCPLGSHWDVKQGKCVPDNVGEDKKQKLFKVAYSFDSQCPPDKIWNPETMTCDPKKVAPTGTDELKFLIIQLNDILYVSFDRLLEAYLNCLKQSDREIFASDVKQKLEKIQWTAVRSNQHGDANPLTEALLDFFEFISPLLSDNNIKSYFSTSNGRKWGGKLIAFEDLGFRILSYTSML